MQRDRVVVAGLGEGNLNLLVQRGWDIFADKARLEDELGDVLFVIANLARHLGVDPEAAIRSTNSKFTSRFKWMEKNADLDKLSLAEMEKKWEQAKSQSR